ncbi:hypothetical protein AAFC00_002232 [Neodothiora populina]|uniref:DUF427 domain-containing protein n=1 Tax=Neodothiora populina TaxID=2781224 RepID=A0ABR3PGT8_9PEZI
MTLNPLTFPRPPLIASINKQILIKFRGPTGPTIASTNHAQWILETHHPPTYYIPPSSISIPLTKSPHKSYCEWKGVATYFDFVTPEARKVERRAWTYEEPSNKYKDLKDWVCFYADERWECYVGGELVEPQPGDFYGGWMTKDVMREGVKGAPGTRGW